LYFNFTNEMKKVLSFFIALALALPALAQQTNVFPEDGKVGIGTTDPTENLDINGNIRIRNLQGTQNRYAIIGPDGVIRDGQLVEGPVSPGGGGGNGGNGSNNTQGTSWSLNGNATNSSHFLGTTNNMPLIFRTNGSQRMVLTSDGKLGLGVTNPVQAFEVAGTIKADALQVTGSTFSTYTNFHVTNKLKVGNSVWINDFSPTTGGSGGKDFIGSTTGTLFFARARAADGEPIFGLANPIKVGIGTDDPQRNLHIRGFGSNEAEFTTYVRIEDISIMSSGDVWSTARWDLGVSANAGGRFFISRPGLSLLQPPFVIHSNGNIGMGLSPDPGTRLQVYENRINIPGLVVGDTSARSIRFVPYLGGAGFNWLSNEGDLGIIFRNQNQNTGQSGFVIAPHGSNSAGIKISANGNVGIGVGNPNAKLQIQVAHDDDRALSILNGSGEQFLITGDGKFYARAYRIKMGNFPDYVFEKDYLRMTPEEKSKYFIENKRLPYMPSAKDIEKIGLDVADGLIGITRNVEENSLDINELFIKIKKLEEEILELKKRLK
jgi:hypothetical protein